MTISNSAVGPTVDTDLKNKKAMIATAIINSMVADSHAMPVHWFYRVSDIRQTFPNGIRQLYDAPAIHPSSIMSLHSKQQGGRHMKNDQQTEVVGSVILKDKANYWDQSQIHYHQGMQAGENTLNAHTLLWLLQAMTTSGNQYQEDAFLSIYIDNMTADVHRHPDTYAESYHRGFFANWAHGKPANQCAAVTHDTPSVGGLVRIGPLALLLFNQGYSLIETKFITALHLSLTHPDVYLKKVSFQYIDLLHDLINETSLEKKLKRLNQSLLKVAGRNFKGKPVDSWADNQVLGGLYSTACYITDSWPSLLFLAAKYAHDTKLALINNAELGGDNVHRGAVLAVILSLINGQRMDDWYDQLSINEPLNHCLNQLGILT